MGVLAGEVWPLLEALFVLKEKREEPPLRCEVKGRRVWSDLGLEEGLLMRELREGDEGEGEVDGGERIMQFEAQIQLEAQVSEEGCDWVISSLRKAMRRLKDGRRRFGEG